MARKRCARLALAAALAAVVGTSFALLGCGPGEVSQPQAEEPGATQGASDETSQAISATTGGYTLAIDGFAIDENGCGFATFTLSNPDGLNGYVGETGEFVSEGTPALDAIQMRAGEDAKPNAYYAMDATSPAATEAFRQGLYHVQGLASQTAAPSRRVDDQVVITWSPGVRPAVTATWSSVYRPMVTSARTAVPSWSRYT